MYINFFKRLLDFLLAGLGFIFLFPLFFTVAIVLFFLNNGKVFFFQPRPGENEKIFKVIKFKSMTDKKDANGELLPFHLRVTKFGNFIRKYSLDEIPQLLNVLKNDMSLVGPRPLLVEYLPLYNSFQKQRHLAKPGITGWAQVNGRNAISWEQKFELDVWYVENRSFKTDLKIILLTVKKVFFKEGVNNSDNLNMTTFTGTPTK
ncbi:sugar transferase [Cellulophaga fucicola]|uniref:Sugar transferase involved in LPS biosynthesis (Colanic, teichoic acid) n=1 Tax=Cellulophaga fucicola TaxID=76595 RepID=A0A1K1M083_9FLAO|nr:sugar transferase [Cellulophaga fucicola]SFW16519.1 Sugar transferase involved in LPS biosynthesis (colanic, teichoic acid) [Cellulophaga fucicola]